VELADLLPVEESLSWQGKNADERPNDEAAM
jgi:hypothetical protein